MSEQLGLLLDGLILVFLCVTIFYAARLSMFLKTFREGREGIQLLIRDLTFTIAKAEEAIQSGKAQIGESEKELRNVVNEAKFLSDELRFMTEGGDGLADRLEKLADRNRELIDLMERSGGLGTHSLMPYEKDRKSKNKTKEDNTAERREPPRKKESYEETYGLNEFDVVDNEMDNDDEHDFLALNDGSFREEQAFFAKALKNDSSKNDDDDGYYDEARAEADQDDEEEIEQIHAQTYAARDNDRDDYEDEDEDILKDKTHYSRVDTKPKHQVRSFAIFDRELAAIELEKASKSDIMQDKAPKNSRFHSKAEEELYEALQRRKKLKENS